MKIVPELDDQYGLAPDLTEYAREKGLDARVFYTGSTYLLVLGEEPEFESGYSLDVAVHIDTLVLDRDLGKGEL